MKILGALVGVLVLGLVGWALFGQNNTETEPKLTFASIETEVNNGDALLVDVRTAAEFAEGYYPPAKNVSLQAIEANNYPSADKAAKIYVYCNSGNRSGQATTLLKKAGYTNVVDLGGLKDVKSIGGKLST
ncbi:MAG: rhodanese-like domain-containing protein [Candidatus Saccharimonadales bacterium]